MPAISSGNQTLLRAGGHKSNFLLLVHRPETTWSALINDGSVTQGETSIAFDGGSGSSFSLIAAYQEVYVGTTAGADDVGRLRVRSVSSGDGGVTGTLTVGRHNLYLGNNYYLTFKIDYPIKPVYPLIDGNGNFFKDGDVAYGSNYNDQPDPVCIAGDHRALRIDSGTGYAQFNVDTSDSYAVASGATISSYGISVVASSGYTTSFNTGTGAGHVRFTVAGQYWVRFTVTDSNGKTQATHRLYFVMPNDRTDSDYGYYKFRAGNVSGSWSGGGWQGSFEMDANSDITSLPNQTIVLLWRESTYGSTQTNITHGADDTGTLLSGYAQDSSFSHDLDTGVSVYNLNVVTPQEILDTFQFSVSLEAVSGTPADWWEYASWLTVGRIIHHIVDWHTTALQVVDFIGLTDNTDRRAFGDIQEGTIYGMCNGLAEEAGIRAKLISDQMGRIHLTQDPQMLPDSDRSSLTTVMALNVGDGPLSDISGPLDFQDNVRPDVAMAKVTGFYFDGTHTDGEPNVTPYCSVAPGVVPHDRGGINVQSLDRQVLTSQNQANQLSGRLWAALNNPYPSVSFSLQGNYAGVFDPAYGEAWAMDLSVSQNPRGITWTAKKLYCRDVGLTIDNEAGTIRVGVTMEPDSPGNDGITTNCLGLPVLGGGTAIVPADPAGALATASSVYFLSAGSGSWSQRSAENVNDMIYDPFWRTRQASTAPSSSILLRCGSGYIKRSTDGGQNWSDITPSGSPTNTASDASPPTFAGLTYVALTADWATQGTFYALGRWQNGSSVWRSWLIKTTDDGTSWTDVQIESGGATASTYIDSDESGPGGASFTLQGGNIAVLSSTSVIGLQPGARAALWSVDGSYTLTVEDTSTSLGSITGGNSAMAALSSTLAVQVFVDSADQGDAQVWYTTIGGTVLNSAAQTAFDAARTVLEVAICAVSSTKILVAWSTASDCFVTHGTLSGTTISWHSTTLVENAYYQNISLAFVGSNEAVLTYVYDDGGGDDGYARVIDTSGTNPSVGSTTEIYDASTYGAMAPVSYYFNPDRHLAVYDSSTLVALFGVGAGGYLVAFTISSGSVNSVGTPLAATDSPQNNAVTVSGSTVFAGGTTGIGGFEISTFSLSGVTLTNLYTQVNIVSNIMSKPRGTVMEPLASGALAVVCGHEDDDYVTCLTVATGAGGGYDIKARGVDVNKPTGDQVWVTALETETDLKAMLFDASTITQAANYNLGTATLAQFDAQTYDAFPACSMTDDDTVWIYGRMNAPQGLSNPSHIIYTTNAGTSWSAYQTSWGTERCGSLLTPLGGIPISIRTGGSDNRVYYGTAQKSTLPFTVKVWAHGAIYDWRDGAVYLAAGAASSVMVAGARPPYIKWSNLTLNHPTGSGVNAIVVL